MLHAQATRKEKTQNRSQKGAAQDNGRPALSTPNPPPLYAQLQAPRPISELHRTAPGAPLYQVQGENTRRSCLASMDPPTLCVRPVR